MKENKITLALLWSRYDDKVTSINDLVVRLDKKHFNILFVFLRGDAGQRNLLREAGYPVLYLSNAKRVSAFHFSVLAGLVRILKEHRVDVLHCHAHRATVYGTAAAVLAGTPVVLAHVHGLGRSRNLKRKLTNFLLFRRIQRIICVADSVREDVLTSNWHLLAGKVTVLENSVDYERFAGVSVSKADAKLKLGLPSDAFVFGTIARFGPYKGHNFLASAFEKVKIAVPSAQLILVGEGPFKQDIQQQAATPGMAGSVHFLGQRNDIPELLRAIDVFVLPSIGSEGMPRVLLEAMAVGVPCIGTSVGGTPELLCNSDIGCLVPPRDADALAEAMITVANTPEQELKGLIERARERIRSNFSHDVVAKKLEDVYIKEMSRKYESDRRQKSSI